MNQVDDQSSGEVARWVAEIKLYEKDSGPWTERARKIVRKYKDERSARENKSRFNILWSNVQTLAPALYASVPKPNIDRRYQDDDDLGRVSAQVLERSVTYFVHTELFDSVMKQCILDRLLGGRGTSWVRYVPHFRDTSVQGNEEVKDDGAEVTDDVIAGDEETGQPEQELSYEEVLPDYVHWEDFGHTYARTWEEVRGVWKKVYMSRSELVARFGEIGKTIPLDYSPEKLNESKVEENIKKATVYEIWDKPSKMAKWLHKDVANLLDELDDPLKLKDFFPCPKPLFATLANDTIIPVPDYTIYQDQANELDELTGRIRSITKSIKVAGVYDASAEGLQRLLVEGVENQLIPVEQWAVFAEKGGMKGVMDLLPMQEIIQTLLALYDAREKCKQVIYEITGISDIIRGQTNPNETLGAQELKGKFASLRLDSQQKETARFARDLVRIMTEIIAEHFSLDTIKKISGFKLLSAQEKQQAQMLQAQNAPQPGMPATPPSAPPLTEQQQEMMTLPTWEEVDALIKNEAARCFRIDIEVDSTIKTDQDAEKASRVELLTAVGNFMQSAVQIPNPELQPLLMELLIFGVRGFKVGRDLETTFKMSMDKLRKAAENPAPPKPDPAVVQAQAQAQTEQQRMQFEMQKSQAEMQSKGQELQGKAQLETQKLALDNKKIELENQISQAELALKQAELMLKEKELQIKQVDSHNNLQVEHKKMGMTALKDRLDAKTKAKELAMTDPEFSEGKTPPVLEMMNNLHNEMKNMANAHQQAVVSASKPKKVTVIKGKDGRLTGAVISSDISE